MKKAFAQSAGIIRAFNKTTLVNFSSAIFVSIFLVAKTADAKCDINSWKYCSALEGTISNLVEAGVKSIQALLGMIGTIALLLLIIAGLTYMTAAGDEAKMTKAKSILSGTVIGLDIALIAYSLLVTLSEIMEVQ